MKKMSLLLLGLLAACGGFSEPVYGEYEAVIHIVELEEVLTTTTPLVPAQIGVIPRERVVSDFWWMVERFNRYSPVVDALYRVYGLDAHEQAYIWYQMIPQTDHISRIEAERVFRHFLASMSPNHIGHLYIIDHGYRTGSGIEVSPVLEWRAVQNGRSNVRFQAPLAYRYLMADHGIAYVRMDGFRHEYLEGNIEAMRPFFETLAEKDYLIIDFSQNPGGLLIVWRAIFQSALAHYMSHEPNLLPVFFRDEESTRARIRAMGFVYSPTSEFDFSPFPEITIGDFDNLGIVIDFTYMPNMQNYLYHGQRLLSLISHGAIPQSDFQGEIFLLIGQNSWSGADGVARFARAHNFATIVGRPPSGIGGSSELPFDFMAHGDRLPNLGPAVRIDLAYTINDVGRWNDEQGTLPDIWQADGMSILGTAIDHIINQGTEHD